MYSFAAGRRANSIQVLYDGTFVWADATDSDVLSTADNQVTMRASGGTRIFSNGLATTGVQLAPGGGSWSPISDRHLKDNFQTVYGPELLSKLAALPISTWNYKAQDASIRHIGPMAQDFRAAFGVGEDDRHITTIDADGVALAAIQGLHQIVQEQKAEIRELCELVEKLLAKDGTGDGYTQNNEPKGGR
ncbi:MAG: tail fiber domain-containing protein [Limisphaerales bacterium]